MQLGGAPPGMLLRAPVAEPQPPPGVQIERVHDARGISDLAAVGAAGFALHGLPQNVALHVFANAERVLSPELACYVAYAGDRPAACASAC